MRKSDESHNMLVVSTSVLDPMTWAWLNQAGNVSSSYPIAVYKKGVYGWFIPIVTDEMDGYFPWDNPKIPKDLRDVYCYALTEQYSWIMFDRDADVSEELDSWMEYRNDQRQHGDS